MKQSMIPSFVLIEFVQLIEQMMKNPIGAIQ
jgi:hypothetical protein